MKSTEDLTRDVLRRAAVERAKQQKARKKIGVSLGTLAIVLALGVGGWALSKQLPKEPKPISTDLPTRSVTASNDASQLTASQSSIAPGVVYNGIFYIELNRMDDAHAQQYLARLDEETLLGDTNAPILRTKEICPPETNDPQQTTGAGPLTEPNVYSYTHSGKLYTIQPYDPQYILALVSSKENDTNAVYLVWRPHNNPMETGGEHLDNVLHLTDRVESAAWKSDTLGDTHHPLQVAADMLQKLIDVLNAAPTTTRPTDREYGSLPEGGKRYVRLTATDGLQIELTLYENGLVGVQGMYDIVHMREQLLQPDDPIIREIWNACE